MRGLLLCIRRQSSHLRITPAYAGTTNKISLIFYPLKGSPLHMRGLLRKLQKGDLEDGITPAYAGTTRLGDFAPSTQKDHPCMCGDYIARHKKIGQMKGSPLHVRGLQITVQIINLVARITPACAGTTEISEEIDKASKDHPRPCGDYIFICSPLITIAGSPPPVRGLHIRN